MRRIGLHLVWFIAAAAVLTMNACTDRPRVNPLTGIGSQLGNGILTKIAEVRYQGNDMQVASMSAANGNIYLSGYPFIYMGWNVSSSPENPTLLFAAATQIDAFAPLGGFTVDNFGAYSQTVFSQYGLLSGMAGLSVINLSNSAYPQEVERIPGLNGAEQQQDLAYIYRAIVPSPNSSTIYGFTQTSGIYTLNGQITSQQVPAMTLTSFIPYSSSSSSVCCVKNAALFQNDIYVAFGNQLWVYGLNSSGQLLTPQVNTQLQAVNVVSTAHAVYIQHQSATASQAGSLSPGIYAFNANGQNVGFLPVSPLLYAIDPTDTYLYTVEQDNTHVNVYSISWTTPH